MNKRSIFEEIHEELASSAEAQRNIGKKPPLWLRLLVPGVDKKLPTDPW